MASCRRQKGLWWRTGLSALMPVLENWPRVFCRCYSGDFLACKMRFVCGEGGAVGGAPGGGGRGRDGDTRGTLGEMSRSPRRHLFNEGLPAGKWKMKVCPACSTTIVVCRNLVLFFVVSWRVTAAQAFTPMPTYIFDARASRSRLPPFPPFVYIRTIVPPRCTFAMANTSEWCKCTASCSSRSTTTLQHGHKGEEQGRLRRLLPRTKRTVNRTAKKRVRRRSQTPPPSPAPLHLETDSRREKQVVFLCIFGCIFVHQRWRRYRAWSRRV